MLVSMAVIFGWQLFIAHLYQQHPEWKRPGQTSTTAPTTAPIVQSTTGPATQPLVVSPLASTQAVAATNPAPILKAATAPTAVVLGANDPDVPMEMRLTSVGASIEHITLKDFKAPDQKSLYIFQKPYDPTDPLTNALTTRTISVNGTTFDVGGVAWNLESSSKRSATFSITVGSVIVRKTFELNDRNGKDKGFEPVVRHTFENLTDQPAKVRILFNGPTTPPRESERGPDLQILSGYDKGYNEIAVTHHMVEEHDAKKPSLDLTRGKDNMPLLWAGTSSVYFNALVRPEPLESKSASPNYIEKVQSFALNPNSDPHERHVLVTFETNDIPVAAGRSLTLSAPTFFGPRMRKLLNDPYYSAFPRSYDDTLVLTSGPCGVCTFQFLINWLVALLGFFHMIFRDWGLAIIALVVVVRLCLHPITKKSQISMLRMSKMGPEMERLKKKHGDNKDELNKAMMGLYKEQGMTPILGCLPMFLQMPIWIALWSSLQSTFELRQAPFLWGYTWIDDLARPDRLIDFGKAISLPFGMHISAINLLPILLGVVFYIQNEIQTRLQPKGTPEQEQQKKIMKYMSLLFPIFLYNGPSGLNLYILTSTTIGIIESKRIRDHIKQKEEEEKAGKVIIDAPATRASKQRQGDKKPEAKKTGLAGLIQNLQNRAEELKREAEKRKN